MAVELLVVGGPELGNCMPNSETVVRIDQAVRLHEE